MAGLTGLLGGKDGSPTSTLTDDRCQKDLWYRAVDKYNSTLLRGGARHRRYIHILTDADGGSVGRSIIEDAILARDQYLSLAHHTKKTFLWRCGCLCQFLYRHHRTVDLFSQIKVITFVWAPARVALQAFDEAQRASQEAVDGIILIEGHLISWIETAAHSSADDRICDIVVGILASAIDLAFLAKEHLALQSVGRFFSSLRPGTVPLDKFTKKKTALQDAMSILSTALHDKRIKFQLDTTTRLESIGVGLSLTEHRVVSSLHVHQSSVEQALNMYDTWLHDWRASSKDTANLKDIQSWLEKDAASFSFQDSHSPIEGTGEWLFQQQAWINWFNSCSQDSKDNGLLWLSGKSGSGKSMLSISVYQRLHRLLQPQSPSKDPLVIHTRFPGGAGNLEASNPSALCGKLLHRLLIYHLNSERKLDIDVADGLRSLQTEHLGGSKTCPWSAIWPICKTAFSRLTHVRYTWIIDGLDECQFAGQNTNGVPSLRRFLDELRDLSTNHNCRIVIFSRRQPDMSKVIAPQFEIRIDHGLNTQDIMNFTTKRLHADGSLIPAEQRERVLQSVRLRADGMFLWAKAMLQYLDELLSPEEFQLRLGTLPSDLSDVYDELIRVTDNKFPLETANSRRRIFVVMLEARIPLDIEDVARILEVAGDSVQQFITYRCQPFIELDDGKLKFMHSSVRDYCLQSSESLSRHALGTRALVSITSFESHSKLAEQCLLCLLDAGYGSEDKIGGLLHRNIKSTTSGSALQLLNMQWTAQPPSKGISFEYARKNWAFHLTAVDDPEYGLLELAQLFLHVSNFAYWAEYTLVESKNDYSQIRRTNLQLKEWDRALPTPRRKQISVEDYLIYPYTTLSESYKRRQGQDKLLQWLALLQNIRFQRDIGQTLKASPLLAQAVEGLENDLGSEAPLTLRVRSDNTTVLLELEAPDKANSELRAIAEIQERLLGEDEPTLFRTLNSRGSAELQLVRFNQSAKTQETACAGFRRLFGAQDPRYLGSRILYALALIQLNQLDTALEILTAVFDYRRKQYGDKDLFTSMAQFPMGDI
ncbi:hypothetical protein BN1708_008838 [Verticillium longisporum]|uniref:Nephrocystin 3-like N-terminal domain-containing protein n=1 Tax=Verticillium longisporum TaxID=100787 RepID=A0A0G4N8L1_VERLO|nr:hypothetical protein BN1708_008838 [Verticillium longisporum]